VLEVIAAFEEACGKKLPVRLLPRRAGDVDMYFADPSLAKRELGWEAKLSLLDMCRDTWRWQKENPQGY